MHGAASECGTHARHTGWGWRWGWGEGGKGCSRDWSPRFGQRRARHTLGSSPSFHLVSALLSAPALINASTAWHCPWAHATCRGVAPPYPRKRRKRQTQQIMRDRVRDWSERGRKSLEDRSATPRRERARAIAIQRRHSDSDTRTHTHNHTKSQSQRGAERQTERQTEREPAPATEGGVFQITP